MKAKVVYSGNTGNSQYDNDRGSWFLFAPFCNFHYLSFSLLLLQALTQSPAVMSFLRERQRNLSTQRQHKDVAPKGFSTPSKYKGKTKDSWNSNQERGYETLNVQPPNKKSKEIKKEASKWFCPPGTVFCGWLLKKEAWTWTVHII